MKISTPNCNINKARNVFCKHSEFKKLNYHRNNIRKVPPVISNYVFSTYEIKLAGYSKNSCIINFNNTVSLRKSTLHFSYVACLDYPQIIYHLACSSSAKFCTPALTTLLQCGDESLVVPDSRRGTPRTVETELRLLNLGLTTAQRRTPNRTA